MRETEEIVATYARLKATGTSCVLATVVRVEGSSYRRAGARMLVDELGQITGAISGGCLEGDALRKALLALDQGRSKLVTYDTSNEEDAQIGAQLGCQGIIHVLFEPVNYLDPLNPCALLEHAVATDRPCTVGVGFDPDRTRPQTGTCWMGDQSGLLLHTTHIPYSPVECRDWSVRALEAGQNLLGIPKQGPGGVVFVQYLRPALRLLLVGAGNDARVLADQALALGWRVTVADGRPSHAREDRFAAACRVLWTRPEDLFRAVPADAGTCVILISHNYQYDLSVLRLLLTDAGTGIPYIGILGPRSRYQRMKDELLREGIAVDPEMESRIYAPVGLEIGAETPHEIALSILAEIQAVTTGKGGGHLRDRWGPIHDRNVEP